MSNHRLDTGSAEGSGHAEDMDSLKHTGFTTAIDAVEHIDLAQVLELYGAKISHIVYLEAGESHLMKGISPRNPDELRGYWEI